MYRNVQAIVVIAAGCFLHVAAAIAGGGEKDFLGKRPGLNQDVQLWNAFLRSETQQDKGSASDAQLDQDLLGDAQLTRRLSELSDQRSAAAHVKGAGIFLDANNHQAAAKHDASRLQAELDACLKTHFSAYLKHASPLPVPVPGQGMAAVAAAAVASLNIGTKDGTDFMKARLQACLEAAQKEPAATIVTPQRVPGWLSWGARTKNATSVIQKSTQGAETEGCKKELKKCKKDKINCNGVLDILQFLRLQHIAVEKNIQARADRRNNPLLLQTVLKENGFKLPKPEDWQWSGAQHKLLLQTALEQDALAVPNQDWQSLSALYHPIPVISSASAPALNHPIPDIGGDIPTRYHYGPQSQDSAMPVKLQHLLTECPYGKQMKLNGCRSAVAECQSATDNLNSILNSVAEDQDKRDRKHIADSHTVGSGVAEHQIFQNTHR